MVLNYNLGFVIVIKNHSNIPADLEGGFLNVRYYRGG